MRINIIIDTENDAFNGDNLGPEVYRILYKYALKIHSAREPSDFESKLKDYNGNNVGDALISENL